MSCPYPWCNYILAWCPPPPPGPLPSPPRSPCLTKLWFLGNIFKFENKSFINFSLPARPILFCSENTSPSKIYDHLGKFRRQKIWIFPTIQAAVIFYLMLKTSQAEMANLRTKCKTEFCAASKQTLIISTPQIRIAQPDWCKPTI